MRKIIISLILVIVPLYAFSIEMSAGFKLGVLGISNVQDKAKTLEYTKLSFNGGAVFDLHFLRWLSCEVYIGYRNLGYRYDYDPYYGENFKRLWQHYHYFHLEATAKIYLIPREKYLSLFVNLGGYFGILIKDGNDNDIGFSAGVGLGIKVKPKISVIVELHGIFGLKNLGKPNASARGPKNVAGYLQCGLLFDFR